MRRNRQRNTNIFTYAFLIIAMGVLTTQVNSQTHNQRSLLKHPIRDPIIGKLASMVQAWDSTDFAELRDSLSKQGVAAPQYILKKQNSKGVVCTSIPQLWKTNVTITLTGMASNSIRIPRLESKRLEVLISEEMGRIILKQQEYYEGTFLFTLELSKKRYSINIYESIPLELESIFRSWGNSLAAKQLFSGRYSFECSLKKAFIPYQEPNRLSLEDLHNSTFALFDLVEVLRNEGYTEELRLVRAITKRFSDELKIRNAFPVSDFHCTETVSQEESHLKELIARRSRIDNSLSPFEYAKIEREVRDCQRKLREASGHSFSFIWFIRRVSKNSSEKVENAILLNSFEKPLSILDSFLDSLPFSIKGNLGEIRFYLVVMEGQVVSVEIYNSDFQGSIIEEKAKDILLKYLSWDRLFPLDGEYELSLGIHVGAI